MNHIKEVLKNILENGSYAFIIDSNEQFEFLFGQRHSMLALSTDKQAVQMTPGS